MLIDNFSDNLLETMVCPVSRESLHVHGDDLCTASGYVYPLGDFRKISSLTQSAEWAKGQVHYERHHRRWIQQPDHVYTSLDEAAAKIYSEIPLRGMVLDVGGGYGLIAVQASLQPGRIVCVDPMVCRWIDVPDSAFKAHYAELEHVVRIPALAEDLPYQNGTFDTVHMRSCLDHFANPHRALLEARRVLKASGQLVVGVSLEGAFRLYRSAFMNFAKRTLKQSPIGEIYGHLYDKHMFHPTEPSLKNLIASAGFTITRWVEESGFFNVIYLSAVKCDARAAG
jgi:ubiquinone/menaquinone biosynthesis C-methylase UbiE